MNSKGPRWYAFDTKAGEVHRWWRRRHRQAWWQRRWWRLRLIRGCCFDGDYWQRQRDTRKAEIADFWHCKRGIVGITCGIMLDNDDDMRGRHAQVQLRKRKRKRKREEEARQVLLVLCVVVNLRLFIIMSKISYLLNYY